MNARHFLSVLLVTIACAVAAPVLAASIDVCFNPAVDARFDSTTTFFVASAPIYPGGTITKSNSPIDCSRITAAPIGTFFTNGGFVEGLPASGPNDIALVTFHFRIGSRAVDTVGVVQAVAPGHTYPLTIVGSAHGGAASGLATVTNLDPTTLVFEVTYPGPSDHEDK